jgi:quercetin dioxygenase-like cupin family protein
MAEEKIPAVNITVEKSNLEGLIAYQTDAVVSITIIGKKAGTVTLFAFDTGQGLSEHTAPYDALVFVVDGSVEITVAGQEIILTKGEMVILPANQPHALKAMSQYKMLLVMIKS